MEKINPIYSIDHKWIYGIVYTLNKNLVKADAHEDCRSCTHFEYAYDKLEHRFNPYCNLFDVWNDRIKVRVIPNELCKIHLRGEDPEQVFKKRKSG